MKSILGYIQGSPFRIDTEFTDAQGKPYKNTTPVKGKKDVQEEAPVYSNRDTVKGQVKITPLTTKKLEHMGIKVQLLGKIEVSSERGVTHEFMGMARGLAGSGELSSPVSLPFEFPNVEMPYDSYNGQQVRCRYLLRVNIAGKGITPDTKHDSTIWVRNFEEPAEVGAPIKMEVGIEDCLHIEFEYDRARYHLRDVVVGKIYFLLVRIKLKHMEVEIRRKETVGTGASAHSELETLAKYEIMDGAPVRGEAVPIRLYLSPYDLSPTYKDVHSKYSVRYFLNLVLVDEEDRRYFKQQEITLFRKRPDTPAEAAAAAAAGPPKMSNTSAPPPLAHPHHSGASSSGTAGASSSAAASAGVGISGGPPPSSAPAPTPATVPASVPSSSGAAAGQQAIGVANGGNASGGGVTGGVTGAGAANGAGGGNPLGGSQYGQPAAQAGTPLTQPTQPKPQPTNPLDEPSISPLGVPESALPPPPPYEEVAQTAQPPPAAAPTQHTAPLQPTQAPPATEAPTPSAAQGGGEQGAASAAAPSTAAAPTGGSAEAAAPAAGASASAGAGGVGANEGSAAQGGGGSAAAAAVDPMLGGGGGEQIGDDLEPLSFGNVEEEGQG